MIWNTSRLNRGELAQLCDKMDKLRNADFIAHGGNAKKCREHIIELQKCQIPNRIEQTFEEQHANNVTAEKDLPSEPLSRNGGQWLLGQVEMAIHKWQAERLYFKETM